MKIKDFNEDPKHYANDDRAVFHAMLDKMADDGLKEATFSVLRKDGKVRHYKIVAEASF